MKWALWLLGLFAVAVAGAFIAGHNEGTVTLFWPPYRVDLSINLVALILLIGFVFLHGVLRGTSLLFDLPRQARRWRLLQKERALHARLLDALAYLLTGRYVRSRKSAQQVLAMERELRADLRSGESLPRHLTSLRILAELVAGESAHALRDQAARDEHLNQALSIDAAMPHLAEYRDAARLCAPRWSLGDRDAEEALRLLDALPQGLGRRTLALRLRLKASRLVHRHPVALETARLLAKHGAFSETASASMLRSLALSSLSEAHDTDRLQRLWRDLSEAQMQDPEVARMAAQRWLQLHGDPAQALQWLWPQWQDWLRKPDAWSPEHRLALVELMASAFKSAAPEAQWLQRLEQAVQLWPQQPELLYLGGVVFLRHQLWGKAQQVLERCAPRLTTAALRRQAWCALAELAQRRDDHGSAALCWKKAALADTDPQDP